MVVLWDTEVRGPVPDLREPTVQRGTLIHEQILITVCMYQLSRRKDMLEVGAAINEGLLKNLSEVNFE